MTSANKKRFQTFLGRAGTHPSLSLLKLSLPENPSDCLLAPNGVRRLGDTRPYTLVEEFPPMALG